MAFSSTKKFSSDTYYPENDTSTVGDWTELVASQTGGKDQFYGDSEAYGYEAFGDAYTMSGRAIGGADYMQGGDYVGGYWNDSSAPSAMNFLGSGVFYAGDAQDMSGLTSGGADTLLGGYDSNSEFYGDASGTMSQSAKGGNDVLQAGTLEANWWYEDGLSTQQYLVGDGYAMTNTAKGGADVLSGGYVHGDGYDVSSYQALVGDGVYMADGAVGGADKLYGSWVESDYGANVSVMEYIMGDGAYMMGSAVGGKDVLYGASANADWDYGSTAQVVNVMAGDGYYTIGTPKFGADTLYGGSAEGNADVINVMFGDSYVWQSELGPASSMGSDFASLTLPSASIAAGAHAPLTYAPDKLFGGDGAQNMMVGDTYYMYQGDKGGADVITGGGLGSENLLVGDAFQATGAVGGADRLVSGAGDDQMYGDFMMNDGTSKGGADVFVFGPDNGNDVIMDFQSGIDHIDLSAFGGFRSMPHTYRALVNSDRVEEQDGAVVIHLDVNDPTSDANTLTIVGVTMRDLQSTFYF